MKIEVDKHDLEFIFQTICYFDMYEDGKYEKWFGENANQANDSFHYLYSLCQEKRSKWKLKNL